MCLDDLQHAVCDRHIEHHGCEPNMSHGNSVISIVDSDKCNSWQKEIIMDATHLYCRCLCRIEPNVGAYSGCGHIVSLLMRIKWLVACILVNLHDCSLM